MIFQEPSVALNPCFRVIDFLSDVIKTHQKDMNKKDIEAYAIELLRRVQIPEPKKVAKRYPHELSGGMKQRVLIAAAIANNPDLLIADEPTSALDVSVQAQILNLLKDLKEQIRMSVIFITHSLGVAAQISDRIAVMYAGKILEVGTVYQIFENPAHPYTLGLLKAVPRITGEGETATFEPLQGTIPDLTNPPPGCRFHPRCRYSMNICREKEPPLIEVEPKHYVACWLYAKK